MNTLIGICTTHGIGFISSDIISRVTFVIRASVTDGGTRRVKPREYELLYRHYHIKYYLSADWNWHPFAGVHQYKLGVAPKRSDIFHRDRIFNIILQKNLVQTVYYRDNRKAIIKIIWKSCEYLYKGAIFPEMQRRKYDIKFFKNR